MCITIVGNVTLSPTCTFSNNTASNGGALWTRRTCDVSDTSCGALYMTSPVFVGNQAVSGGGGAIWCYAAAEISYSCPGSSITYSGASLVTGCPSSWSGNQGVYGNIIASTAASLAFNNDDPYNFVVVNSSSAVIPRYLSSGVTNINMPISVSVVDFFGQNISAGSAECTASFSTVSTSSGWTLSGITTLSASRGTAQYSSLYLKAPAADYTLQVSTASTFHTVAPIFVTVSVRKCIVGEVTNSQGDQCTFCDGSTYSFWPQNTTCDACPDNADCDPVQTDGTLYKTSLNLASNPNKAPPGNVLIPVDGYWHSSPMSPQVHVCPNVDACTYSGRETALLGFQVELYNGSAQLYSNFDNATIRTLVTSAVTSYWSLLCAPGYKVSLKICSVHPRFIHEPR